jgi:uncharacterized OsmC-like protein
MYRPFLRKIDLIARDVHLYFRAMAAGSRGDLNISFRTMEMTMNTQAALAERPAHVNGLDVGAAFDTIKAIKADPNLARFQFRARNVWIDGGVNRSTIRDFYGAGREDDSRMTDFVFTNGEPPVLLGNNEGANPVEFLLHALAGCVTTTLVLHAAARGIAIEELSTELEGDLDVQGLLGLDESVSPGYEQILIKMTVKADCSDEELDDLLSFSQEHSPVCNTVCRPVPVKIERVKV